MDIFALAAKKKFRWDSVKGELTVEDLWDLPLTSPTGKPNLDDIAKKLYKEIKDGEEVSFVTSNVQNNIAFATLKAKFDIVKFIIDIKVADADKAKKAQTTKAQNQRILEILAQQEDAALVGKPREELLAMLSANTEANDELGDFVR